MPFYLGEVVKTRKVSKWLLCSHLIWDENDVLMRYIKDRTHYTNECQLYFARADCADITGVRSNPAVGDFSQLNNFNPIIWTDPGMNKWC